MNRVSFPMTSCVASSLKLHTCQWSQEAKLPEVGWSNTLLAKSHVHGFKKQFMVWNVSFLKIVQQTSLGAETASIQSEGHRADNCTRGVFVSQSTKYLWSEYCWLEQSRWLSHCSILLLAPWCKPQLWIDNLDREFCMHGNLKCTGQCFWFSNTDIWCLIYKNVISPNCKHIFKNCFGNKVQC